MDTLGGDSEAPKTPISRSAEVSRWLYDNTPIPETMRFKTLDRFEAFYRMRHYDHLDRDWWGMTADQAETVSPSVMVPKGYEQPAMAMSVRAKRPTAPYQLCNAIVDRFTGLLFSEGRKPEVLVEGDQQTEEWLRAAMQQARFWPNIRQARAVGGSVGSVCVTAHIRDGKFALEVHNAKFLTVLWKDRRSFTPRGILKQYKFKREQAVRNGETGDMENRPVTYLYRRVITEHEDIVFKPVELRDGEVPPMEIAGQVVHNMGFFPGVWIQNLPVLEEDDGDPDCAGQWQTFDTMDRLIAQMNKGVLTNMDPTLKLKVDPKIIELGGGVRKGSDNAINVGLEGDVGYVEISGAGITVAGEFLERLRQNVLDTVPCVLVDPDVISGAAQSAKAIEYLYAPMLEKADVLRSQYGDMGIVPLCEIMLKMSDWADDQGMEVDLPLRSRRIDPGPGAHPGARSVSQSFPHTRGPGGLIKLSWGPYFAPTEQDKQMAVNTIVAAMAGGLIDDETAVKAGAQVFKVKDAAAMHRKIKEAQDDQDEKDQAGLDAGVPPPSPEGTPKPGEPQPAGGSKVPGAVFGTKPPGKPPGKTPPAGFGGKP